MGATIGDLLGENLPEDLKHHIEIGNVYKIPLTKNDGVFVEHEEDVLLKYFIVIGFDDFGNVYGGLLISSEPPKNIPLIISLYQYPIKAKNNSFLKWDSWVNCTKIFQTTSVKLSIRNFIGYLDKESLYYIINAILDEKNTLITPKEKKKFKIQSPNDIDNY